METFTSYNQILIFEEQLQYVCPIWIFIFDTDEAQAEGHFLQKLNFKRSKLFLWETKNFLCFIILLQIF